MRLGRDLSTWLKIKWSSFRNKLMLSMLLLSIVPIILVGLLSYNLSYKIARDGILNSISYSSGQLNTTLTSRFKQMEDASGAIQFYLYTVVLQESDSISEQLEKFSYLKNNISNLQYTFGFFDISVYTKPDLLFSNQGINYFKIEELEKHGLAADDLMSHINQLQWNQFRDLTEPFMKRGSYEHRTTISSYLAFKTISSATLDYVFFIDIEEKEISDMLARSSPNPSVTSMIVDGSGSIISHIDPAKLGTKLDDTELRAIQSAGQGTVALPDKRLVVNPISVAGWYLVTDVPNEYLTENVNILVNVIIITLLSVVAAAVIAGLLISNHLSTKIRRMSKVMSDFRIQDTNDRLIQLHIPVDQDRVYRDELDRLATVFNAMVQKINENFDQLLELRLHEENLRYQLLQAKINPHFLYNILESIKTCQSLGRIEDANAMISRLAKFYRLTLRKGDDLISIQDELEIVTLYLEMEKLSHNHSFVWSIEQEEGIGHFLIPKFTLQPLLENCIRHGLSDDGRMLEIRIKLVYREEEIGISIRDNGVGIPADRLEDIRGALRSKIVSPKRYYGLSNVNVRLSKHALHREGLTVDSDGRSGTTITACIQQMIPDENEW